MNGPDFERIEKIVTLAIKRELAAYDIKFVNILQRLDVRHEMCVDKEKRIRRNERAIEGSRSDITNVKESQKGMFALAQLVAGVFGAIAGMLSGFFRNN